jgi:DNA-binding CsgD family transcriptional regulator
VTAPATCTWPRVSLDAGREEVLPGHRVERGQRLVEHQQLGPPGQRDRQRELRFLPAGQIADPLVQRYLERLEPVKRPPLVPAPVEVTGQVQHVRDRQCERVADGGTAMDPEVIARLLARNDAAEGPLAKLSPREREVLELMAEGRSNAAIAQRLFVTERAVAKHTASIFLKLDLQPSDDDNRRVLAVLAYLGR